MIQVNELRVDYDNLCAVQDLSLAVEAGEVFGLIGPNGCGKTTTFRAILGLIEPTYGEVEMAGIDCRERLADATRLIGFMPDYSPLYEDLKVWEFLDLFASSYFIPRAQRLDVIDRQLERVELTGKRTAFLKDLSRGMRQRLMLAKTLIHDPAILILDEPASGMDPHGRAMLKGVLNEMAKLGKAVLISSHILSEMSEFCTAVGIMERGRLVEGGKVEEVARRVVGAGVIRVETLPETSPIETILAADPHAGAVTRTGFAWEFSYADDDSAVRDLLRRLVAAEVPVTNFNRRRGSLEDIFMKVGAKEVT